MASRIAVSASSTLRLPADSSWNAASRPSASATGSGPNVYATASISSARPCSPGSRARRVCSTARSASTAISAYRAAIHGALNRSPVRSGQAQVVTGRLEHRDQLVRDPRRLLPGAFRIRVDAEQHLGHPGARLDQPITFRRGSGSRRSPSPVEPVTSQNRTVTVFRVSARGCAAWNGVPQYGQKANPSALSRPQLRQDGAGRV